MSDAMYVVLGRLREAELEISEAVIKCDEGEIDTAGRCVDEAAKSLDLARQLLSNLKRS